MVIVSAVIIIVICHLISGVTSDSRLFCLQGSWSNTNLYSGGSGGWNASSAAVANSTWTSDDMCQVVDLENTLAYPKPRLGPIVNPVCTYPNDYETYVRLLEGPLYDYACFAQGKKCVKWTMYNGPVVLNVSRLCAVAQEIGCFTQTKGDTGVTTEVCICDDQHFCNASHRQLTHDTTLWSSLLCLHLLCRLLRLSYRGL